MSHFLTLALQPPVWQSLDGAELNPRQRDWLGFAGSLTERLGHATGKPISVDVLTEVLGEPWIDEAPVLELARLRGWLREIYLNAGGEAQIFGRSFIPMRTLESLNPRLDRLGETPLGQVLFQLPGLKRRDLQVALLDARHRLYQRAIKGLDAPPCRLWARRSVFEIRHLPLLVTEVFLPGSPLYETDTVFPSPLAGEGGA
ncbi:MAG: chorismate lyase [Gammaproteobacteria bacterium]|nr:chorismate lyase [Gammaproteobacteria bacterium]